MAKNSRSIVWFPLWLLGCALLAAGELIADLGGEILCYVRDN